MNVTELFWPVDRLGDALQAAVSGGALSVPGAMLPDTHPAVRAGHGEAVRIWLETAAAVLELQVESRPLTYGNSAALLQHSPAIVWFERDGHVRLLVIEGSRDGRIVARSPAGEQALVSAEDFRSDIAYDLERSAKPLVDAMLVSADIPKGDRADIVHRLVERRLRDTRIAEICTIAPLSSRGIWALARLAGLPGQLARFVASYALEYALWIASWILIGRWSLEGRFDGGWLAGWAVLLLTIVPVHALNLRAQSALAIRGCCLTMRLMLEGAFRLNPEEVRTQGVGQLMGRVIESESLQSLALAGGLLGVVSLVELAVAACLLAIPAQSPALGGLLVAWTAMTTLLAIGYHWRRRTWTDSRLAVTDRLIETMVGHRTRLVQERPARWHDGEDALHSRYLVAARRMDRLQVLLTSLVSHGWLVVAVGMLTPDFVSGTRVGLVAGRLGAILLAYAALRRLSAALANISGAWIACNRVADFLDASRRREAPGDPTLAVETAIAPARHLLEMRDVGFAYPHRAQAALHHVSFTIDPGDRVLVEGPSGSGKSTWVGVATGVRAPDSGLLFLKGIDRRTMGEREWRKRVAGAPQFHENHIFSGSLAFNLLMGRGWPPRAEDLADADAVCRELGLGPLLDRMPSGIMQMVGETGWQLSHGERARVYLARTLLQGADMIVMDETLGALDPETAHQVVDCVLRRAPTLVCVAHQ